MAKKKELSFQDKMKHLIDEARGKMEEFGKEASIIAKKSEKEISKMSQIGKLQTEIAVCSVKREQIYWQVGKKAVELYEKGRLRNPHLKPLCENAKKLGCEVKDKQKKIKTLSRKEAPKTAAPARGGSAAGEKATIAKKKTAKKTPARKKTVKKK